MFVGCKGSLWRDDDFSKCFQRNYLQIFLPLIAIGASIAYLLIQLFVAYSRSRRPHEYKLADPVGNGQHIWPADAPRVGRNDSAYNSEDASSDELNHSPTLDLRPVKTHESVVEVDKPLGELWIVVLEEAAVLATLGIQAARLILKVDGRYGQHAEIAGLVVWAYIATIASLRLLFSATHRLSFPKLWYHTAFIYGYLWVISVLLFRSALLHPRSDLARGLSIAEFSLTSLLFLISLTSRKGNKVVELEYENGIQPSKEQTASVLSLATFGWVDAIVWKGYQKTFEMSDVWNVSPHDKAAYVIATYRQLKKTHALAWHLLRFFRRQLLIQAAWAGLSGFLTFAPTLLLKVILEYVEQPSMFPRNAAWFFVMLLFVSGCASALADGQTLWIGRKICIRIRAVIIGEIYSKALKRRVGNSGDKVLGQEKKRADGKGGGSTMKRLVRRFTMKKSEDKKPAAVEIDEGIVSSGAVINLMAVDSFKLSEICAYLHFLWAATPVQVITAVVLLYQILGYSSIAGIGLMAGLLPINLLISKKFSSIQKQILAATDSRINSTNEVLSNIRIIKFFAWEQRFIGQVDETRSKELGALRRKYMWWATAATVWSGSPIVITFLSFFIYTIIEKRDLVPSVAFTALSLFQILRIPLDQLADMVAHVQESKVSVDRIDEFLNEAETDKYNQLHDEDEDEDDEQLIGFEKGTFSWGYNPANGKFSDDDDTPKQDDAFRLMDLNVSFCPGELNVVVGPTGSGKSSLLMALLGEMTLLSGRVFLPGGRSREDLRPDPETGLTESVAYCAQQAWLVNDTIRENILFADTYDAQRYKDVIVACSLQRDLEILDHGDQTLVGEKGVTLSGGQKQRISLARALYSHARHVLLDDVLSAVDSHTAKWIFDQAILGPLMYNRTCILVTHNVALCLPHAHEAIVMENGRIVTQGTSREVINSGKLSEDLSKSGTVSPGPSRVASRVPSDVGVDEPNDINDLARATSRDSAATAINDSDADGSPMKPANGPPSGLDAATGTEPIEMRQGLTETKAEGGVKLAVIALYFKAMGRWYYWVAAAFVFIAQQITSVATNVWIREWANAYTVRRTSGASALDLEQDYSPAPNTMAGATHFGTLSGLGSCLSSGTCPWGIPSSWSGNTSDHGKARSHYGANMLPFASNDNKDVNPGYYLTIYAVLGLIYMFVTLAREGVLFAGSLTASRRIHTRLIQAVSRAKFRFFDSTPLGQIMNRFSKDIEAIDQEVAPTAIGVIHCLASIITIVILISVITPAFLIAGFFISIFYFLIGKFYINSSRDLKRLESIQRSPLYQQFGETLSGMTTIRAYGDERRFIRENLAKINTHNRPFIYLWAANRWLAFRVDVVGAMVSFFTGAFVLLSVGKIDAGAAGLAMTYAVTFTENVLWFVRLYAANEQNMNSVERIKEYLDVEQEAAAIIPHTRPPSNWPSQGSVEFIAYSTRYRADFDFVLKKITFKIAPGEKVGVVGRTGAGKSSLALALFRALEAEEGKILVDDVDIGLIGLQDLRENIVMVPQDPTLFTGTIRSNLDPFGLFTDEEIYASLRGVQLISETFSSTAATNSPARPTTPAVKLNAADTTASSSDAEIDIHPSQPSSVDPLTAENKNIFRNLSSPVTESGSNLSQGQRQLLCLARAMLKTPKVLLMDEATASIDYATDAKIQETIRELQNTTITIAHRLQTIIDYDKVLVLDKGAVIEYGDPYDLVTTEGGTFRGMCETTGDLEGLVRDAKTAWKARQAEHQKP
ncbi:hypothetical protein P152DRAFT_465906 [Eremomyces bilateralis CBS 781.70]|uniref:ATP-dependent bile acid permease n=1 Tax=Eremomyces bilateralis CBS 781.70 TaxID=1392243 RepID=A0A6G1G613_9PEZI|nr:uncharacterized protein P152DRAFT_465906 [Eremomyces bilateralis CBS 781.70]KAF1813269.1 hypothetical protein P152DRAFT_465906 [Eremomyces bilateralis CBS 781.70]